MFKQFAPALAFNRQELLRRILGDDQYIENNGDTEHLPLRTILTHVASGPTPCRSVLLEKEYIDRDYQDEYAAFYSKIFRVHSPRCLRVHFFACEPNLLGDPQNLPPDVCQTQYLGFVVIRPTEFQHVGRSLLVAQIADRNHDFVHAQCKFKAHIYGQELPILAAPFIQQDTQVGACAHASLWMLARYMSTKFGYREYLPSEINNYAKQHHAGGRHYPAEMGLYPQQMLDALRGMGLPAMMYSFDELDSCAPHINPVFPKVDQPSNPAESLQLRKHQCAKLADIAYRYIESSLPVIFLTSNHAFVGIGHTYAPSATATVTIQRVPAFLTNNDNSGPYLKVPLLDETADFSFLEVEAIIAILPQEVSLRGEDAESAVQTYIRRLVQSTPELLTAVGVANDPQLLEFRTYLMESVRWQQYLRENSDNIVSEVAGPLVRLDYPKFVWVTEVSTASLLNSPDRAQRMCLGHVVVDSTAAAAVSHSAIMAYHFSDMLMIFDRHKEEPPVQAHVPGSTPFPHMLRAEGS